jgi:hypothetical protein
LVFHLRKGTLEVHSPDELKKRMKFCVTVVTLPKLVLVGFVFAFASAAD